MPGHLLERRVLEGSSSTSKATTNALRSCFSFASDNAPIYSVSMVFSRRMIWWQLMTGSCFKDTAPAKATTNPSLLNDRWVRWRTDTPAGIAQSEA